MHDSHRCKSGRHCVSRNQDGAALTSREDSLCGSCVDDCQWRLVQLPDLALALRAFIGGGVAVAYQSKISATKVPSTPLNIRVTDLLSEIAEVIDRAGGTGMQIHNLILQPATKETKWFGDRPETVYQTGVEKALDVRRVHQKAAAIGGLERTWQRRHAPCANCGLPCVGMWSGSDSVECTACGQRATLDEYSVWVSIQSEKEK